MKPKIIKTPHFQICLYCGDEIPAQIEDREYYYECDCPDAKKKRDIKEKIRKLEREIPDTKYMILQENVLHKLDFDDENKTVSIRR